MGADQHRRTEFRDHLDLINMKRARASAFMFSLALPCILILIAITGTDTLANYILMAICIAGEIVQTIFAVIFNRIIMKKSAERFGKMYFVYYAVTMAFMLFAAGIDMTVNKIEVAYIVLCVYFICVPVFNRKVRLIYIAVQGFIVMGMMAGTRMNARFVIDMVVIQIATLIMSEYQHNLTIRCERITQNLKRKTICSEQDDLTGLANRRGLEKKIEPIWAICQRKKIPVAMIALDIDYFKKYNDKFGHPEGDKCIRVIADTLKETARRSSDIITRTGGEEFLIFLQDITPKDVLSLALKIRKNIDEKAIPHAYCAISKNVTVSMGIATVIPKFNQKFSELYEAADKELYLAKKNGRNCIVFDGCIYGRFKNGMAQVIDMK